MGSLPFRSIGDVTDRNGTVLLSDVPMTVFPDSGGYGTPGGQRYDHSGHIRPAADVNPEVVKKSNRRIVCDGATYNLVDATYHEFVGVIEARLTQVLANG